MIIRICLLFMKSDVDETDLPTEDGLDDDDEV